MNALMDFAQTSQQQHPKGKGEVITFRSHYIVRANGNVIKVLLWFMSTISQEWFGGFCLNLGG